MTARRLNVRIEQWLYEQEPGRVFTVDDLRDCLLECRGKWRGRLVPSKDALTKLVQCYYEHSVVERVSENTWRVLCPRCLL